MLNYFSRSQYIQNFKTRTRLWLILEKFYGLHEENKGKFQNWESWIGSHAELYKYEIILRVSQAPNTILPLRLK